MISWGFFGLCVELMILVCLFLFIYHYCAKVLSTQFVLEMY